MSNLIRKDCETHKKGGPFKESPFPNNFCSPIRAVVKRILKPDGSTRLKVRVVHDLSHPWGGASVNSGVVAKPFSLQSFQTACDAIVRLSKGRRGRRDIWLIKLDVAAAYKQIAVRPEDWHLLGFRWLEEYFTDHSLPFGLRSSCRLWDLIASALEYMFRKHLGIHVVVHYVDDFLFVVKGLDNAQSFLAAALQLCIKLGVPIAEEKNEGPIHSLTFLGLWLDTVALEARFSDERLAALRRLTLAWLERKSLEVSRATVKELQSLLGVLQFAARVMPPARHFTRRITGLLIAMEASINARKPGAPRPANWLLPLGTQLDLQWWHSQAQSWNGVSLMYDADWTGADRASRVALHTDACEIGYGAVCNGEWFNGAWSAEELAAAQRGKKVSMPFLETLALVYAAATWAHKWRGKKITFHTDCIVSTHLIGRDKRNSKEPRLQALVRTLCEIACNFEFDYRCDHIDGVKNIAADALSRFNDAVFRSVCPRAQLAPTPPRKDLVPLPELPPPPSSEWPQPPSPTPRERHTTPTTRNTPDSVARRS